MNAAVQMQTGRGGSGWGPNVNAGRWLTRAEDGARENRTRAPVDNCIRRIIRARDSGNLQGAGAGGGVITSARARVRNRCALAEAGSEKGAYIPRACLRRTDGFVTQLIIHFSGGQVFGTRPEEGTGRSV